MAANMYRIGDYVYFETSSSSPYQIRRIEELNKTQSGNVEARVMCYYRRRDVPSSLTVLADKNQSAFEEGQGDCESVTDKVRHQINHRELFMTRHVETLPATHIRGKCAVTLLNETENQLSYLANEDTFFYTLVYDPAQRTLLGDRGEIRVGTKYQADITPLLQEGEDDARNSEELETLTWTAEHNISDRQIDQFLVIARSVGTFARALDCSSSVKQPSLHMSAAAASRDITLFHAMDTLHKHKYDLSQAISSLVPSSGPILCRDEMEEWAASEANLFEEALEKYGKDFTDIRQDFLPWKTLKNIVEYYYMWKTTDRYVQQKRVKAADSESKLKQVYIPNYNLTNPAVLTNNKSGVINGASNEIAAASGKACESCMSTQSSQWYAWGPMHMQCRLCSGCWVYWKKYGGLKVPTRLDGEIQPAAKDTAPKDSGKDALMCNNEKLGSQGGSHRPHKCVSPDCGKEFKLKSQLMRHCATVHGMALRAGSPRPIVKTRAAFFLCTGFLTRLARRMCKDLLKQRKAARNPFTPINAQVIKAEFVEKTVGKTVEDLKQHAGLIRKVRCKVNEVSRRLSMTNMNTPPWLILTDKNSIPKPENPAFPPPPRGPDGRYLVDPILSREIKMKIDRPAINNLSHNSLLRKRPYDDHNGPSPKKHHREGVTSLKPAMDVLGGRGMASRVPINHLNGRNKGGSVKINRKHLFSWMDAPDDVYFIATEATRKLRSQLTISELRRAGRKPFRSLNIKLPVLESTSAMNLSRFQ